MIRCCFALFFFPLRFEIPFLYRNLAKLICYVIFLLCLLVKMVMMTMMMMIPALVVKRTEIRNARVETNMRACKERETWWKKKTEKNTMCAVSRFQFGGLSELVSVSWLIIEEKTIGRDIFRIQNIRNDSFSLSLFMSFSPLTSFRVYDPSIKSETISHNKACRSDLVCLIFTEFSWKLKPHRKYIFDYATTLKNMNTHRDRDSPICHRWWSL